LKHYFFILYIPYITIFINIKASHITLPFHHHFTQTKQRASAIMVQNKKFIYKQIPQGEPVAGKDLVIETSEFDIDQAPPAGGVTVKNIYASLDPYQRGRMRDPSIKSYMPAWNVNDPVNGGVISKVIKSDHSNYKEGDLVAGFGSYTEYSALPKQQADGLKKLPHNEKIDPVNYSGPLGMPGLTAYSSLYEIGKPQKGETIFISSAAGAVGALVGQIAKHEGLRVVGSVGSEEKLKYITEELGFDGGFNYKEEKPLDALKRLCPDGIDIYFENVGGEQLEASLTLMNQNGRIIVCGMISDYNKAPEERYGIKNLMQLISQRLTVRGFLVGDKDFGPKYEKERTEKVSEWLADGSFKAKLHVTKGIDNGPEAFLGMLSGKNFGKAVLQIGEL